jgi:hypothetical protein
MPSFVGVDRLSLIVEMARWDEAGKAIIVPMVRLEDQRTFGCAITDAAIHAVLERLMGPDEYIEALRRHSAPITAIALSKIEAGAVTSGDRVAIDWPDVTSARWHI